MRSYHVVYDGGLVEEFNRDVKPLLEGRNCQLSAYTEGDSISLEPETQVLLWLGDEALHAFIPYAIEHNLTVGFLPHPQMKRAQRLFLVPQKMAQALDSIDQSAEATSADLLFCNQQLVLGAVMLGDPKIMWPEVNIDSSLWNKLKHFVVSVKSLSQTRLLSYKLLTQKESVVATAGLGITAAYRPSASNLMKTVVDEAEQDTPSLNAITLAPRSTVEVVKFLFSRFFPTSSKTKTLPSYIGHIKTQQLTITGGRPLSLTIDGVHSEVEKVELEVRADALKVMSQTLPAKSSEEEIKESVRMAYMPRGEAVQELVERPLPWIYHAEQEEVKATFINLKESARTSESYLVLMVLSTLLATVGLFANSAPVIIGAMILAPLMSPIISLSMGVLRQSSDLVWMSSKTLFTGILLALAFGTLLTLLTPLHTINSEISARLSPTILDLGVAIISGIAGAYASARSEVAKSLAGVAIAVALVPPLAVAGIGIGWLDWSVFWGAFLLFVTNLVGIVLAASLAFLVMGFSPFRLAKRGMTLSLMIAAIISIPLVLAFNTMVKEQGAVYALNGWKTHGVELRVNKVLNEEPMYVSVKLLSPKTLSSEDIDQIKRAMEHRLQQPIQLEAITAVVR